WTELRPRKHHETPRLQARGGHGGAQQSPNGSRMDGPQQHPRLQRRGRSNQNLLHQPTTATRACQAGKDGSTKWSGKTRMSLLDPIVSMLGPIGPVLAASDMIIIGLALLGLISLGLYFAKKTVFDTSKAWV